MYLILINSEWNIFIMSRLDYIVKRLLFGILTLFGVLTITFVISRLMPGDPESNY